MTWAIAGLVAGDAVDVDRFEAVDVSYPRFDEDLRSPAGRRRCRPSRVIRYARPERPPRK